MPHKILLFMLMLASGFAGLQAQESINAAGGNATGSGGSVSGSVGQVFFQTHSETNGSVSEGVQQPYEISIITAIEEAKGINLSVSAYPNPTSDNLTLDIDEFDFSDLSYQLYDMRGRLLQSERIISNRTTIAMGSFVPGTYFVRVLEKNREVKTFKIVKR